MNNPTRIELDLPIVVVNQYGHLQLDNLKSVSDVVSGFYAKGTVLTLHIVAEDTGLRRGFCDFIKDRGGTYPHMCGLTLSSAEVCPNEDEHAKERNKQLELVEGSG